MRFISVLIAAAFLLVLSVVPGKAQDQDGFKYSVVDNTVTILGYDYLVPSLTIPGTIGGLPVTTIAANAFANNVVLTTIVIPDSVTSIGDSAFTGCSQLAQVTLGKGVTTIGANAFSSDALEGITVSDAVLSIGAEAFKDCEKLSNATIGKSVTTIGEGAFSGCALVTITIPASVTSVGVSAFNCGSLKTINVAAGNTAYSSINGFLFNINQTMLIQAPGSFGGAYTIPQRVTQLGESAFAGCAKLSGVTIPNGVRSLPDNVFEGCSKLSHVVIPGSITTIEANAFEFTGLTSVTIPNGVTSIGDNAFASCYSLTSVTIAGSVITIGNDAFYICPELANLTISNGVTSIGKEAFASTSLGNVTIPKSVTSIGEFAFDSAKAINVASGNPVYSSQNGVLFDLNKTTLIEFPGALDGTYTIPSSVTSVGNGAFYLCQSLSSVIIPNSVTTIGEYAFSYTFFIKNITIPGSVTSIGAYAFYSSGLTFVTIPSSVSKIGDEAFYQSGDLEAALFLGNAPTMGKDVFRYSYFTNAYPYYGDFDVYYLPGAVGFSSPGWVDSSGDYYPSFIGLPHVNEQATLTAVIESGQQVVYNISTGGFSGPYQLETTLPSWMNFDPTRGLFSGTAPVASGRLLGAVNVTAMSLGQQVQVTIDFILVNNLNGSGVYRLDVGDVSQSGETQVSPPNTYTLTGWGTGLGNGAGNDGYQYVYLPVTGDFTMITQVKSQSGGESGIVIKDGLDQWSTFFSVMLKPAVGTIAEYALGSNPATILGQDSSMAGPLETIGLVRSGNTFTEYELVGAVWKQIGSVTPSRYLPLTLYAGLAESSDNNNTSATATFSNVQVLPYAE